MRTYKGLVKTLGERQFFVVGTNTEGRHGKGAALYAKENFGLKPRIAVGFNGQCYGIVTKDLKKRKHPSMSKEYITSQIAALYRVARSLKNHEFLVAYNVNGELLNGYTHVEMAAMFNSYPIPENIVFEEGFAKLILELQKRHQHVSE